MTGCGDIVTTGRHETMVCCGACGLALVLACESAGLEVFGSPTFCDAIGVPLRPLPLVAWDLPAENRTAR